jgi:hypothetical protein
MKTTIEVDESDLRSAVLAYLRTKYPADVLNSFASNDFHVKMTYRANETWRRPKFLRLVIERHTSLTS